MSFDIAQDGTDCDSRADPEEPLIDTVGRSSTPDVITEAIAAAGDEDDETTITVLQRTIANVGGDAWHW